MKIFFLFLILISCNAYLVAQDFPDSDASIVQVKIAPSQVTVKPGEKVQFSFHAIDRDGHEIPAAFSWSFSGGTLEQIGPDCLYTAGNVPGEYELRAEISTGVYGIARITILDLTPPSAKKVDKIIITPDVVMLKPGQVQKFDFCAYNNLGRKMYTSFKISFGGGQMDGKGNYTAGDRLGKYKLTVRSEDGVQASADIIISHDTPVISSNSNPNQEKPQPTTSNAAIPSRIEITPKSKILMVGESCQFKFAILNNESQPVAGSLQIYTPGGTIDGEGIYTAGKTPGDYVIHAQTDNKVFARAEIKIVESIPTTPDVETPAKPVLIPQAPKLPTESTQTTNQVPQTPESPKQIATEQPTSTNDSSTGINYTTPIAKPESVSSKIETTNPSGKLVKFAITPNRLRLRPGEKRKLYLIATDSQGRRVPTSVEWSYRGGILDNDGTFTAGMVSGQNLIVAQSDQGLTAKAIIAILSESKDEMPYWIELEPNVIKLKPGQKQKFECRLTNDSNKVIKNVDIQYEAMGGEFDPETMIYTAWDESGDYYLEAFVSDNIRMRAHIEIKQD